MKLVEILQGKWLGHPLHAAVVHVPVGGWLVACVLDFAAAVGWGGVVTAQVAWWSVGVGLAGAGVAAPTGVADWSAIKKEKPAWRLGLYHLVLNVGATLVWAVNFGLRFNRDGNVSGAVLVTSAVGALLVIVSAYLGMRMVFDHGIGVARTSKAKWREIAARGGARLADEK
jgi:uncharacterized membrane protein